MAKVTAPLFSFTARGQLAKSLVYFPWKGIASVRQYVVPANPNTGLQDTVRQNFEDAVDEYHLAKYVASDKIAWNRRAGAGSLPMSGFNAFIKSWMELKTLAVAVVDPGYAGALAQSGAGQFDITVTEAGEATAVNCIWGYGKNSLLYTQALAEVVNVWGALDVVAASGAIVYAKMEIMLNAALIGETGIFQVKIL